MSKKLIQKTKTIEVPICKLDEEKRLAFGWAFTSKTREDYESDWVPYIDLQDDEIPEDVALDAAKGFAEGPRVAKDMHQGDQIGEVIFVFPLTEENAEAMDVQATKSGVMVGMRVDDDEVWEMFKSGERRAFSIGGMASSERVE